MTTEIILPEMGEGVIEGTLSRWLVREGDKVKPYDPIAEIETDKVTTEISTEVAGIVLKLCVNEGETIPVETVLAFIGNHGEEIPDDADTADSTAVSNGQDRQNASMVLPTMPEPAPAAQPEVYKGRVSPVVGRIAAEHNVDLAFVTGTGRDGRITKQDILAYLEMRTVTPPEPAPATTPPRTTDNTPTPKKQATLPASVAGQDDELFPLTGMRRTIAEHMVLSKRTSPHVTTVFEFDFSAVATHRAAHKENFARDGAKLTYTVYIVAATVQALKQHPLANSVWTDDGLILRREINIGMAAAVPEGLIVPVIEHADEMNLLGLAKTINDLAYRARNKKLMPSDVQGGTFSITNHGTSGSLLATPIINQPQAGILGIGKIEKRVKVVDDAIAIRPLAFASFTFDHRILDGATADGFVSTIKDIIEGWH
ncbi:MAG: 2-oxo acid dehydrogenase subunit E2 [Anaerolineaceae bacterium]|nr:MAG: 2-oxo acid dehydrogenase subunit E2 [Anaerolineaceae bacterium]